MDPISQFAVREFTRVNFFGNEVVITNSNITTLIISICCIIFMYLGTRNTSEVPSKIQLLFENIVLFVENMLNSVTKGNAKKFFPLVFCLFIFVLLSNLYGMIPFTFSITSQFLVTTGLALIVFFISTIYGLVKHKARFFSIFAPAGTPLWLMPLMIVIEIMAYFMKPISLSLRLAANMCAGHILIKVIASLASNIVLAPFFALFVGGLMAFEVCICILQAYIFTMLTCVYINDVVNLH